MVLFSFPLSAAGPILYTIYTMSLIVLLTLVYIMGFLVAIPAGPVQIEVVKRSVHGHLKPAFMVILGAFFIDMFYGVVAFFGIAPFLELTSVKGIFWLCGGVILGFLGVLTIRHSRPEYETRMRTSYLRKKRWSLLSGATLSVTNPVMILWWLSGLNIFKDFGLVPAFTTPIAISYLFAGSLGLASYLLVLSLVIYRAKDFISLRNMRKINMGLGITLLLLAGYFLVHAALIYRAS